jgi:hypothetical protein
MFSDDTIIDMFMLLVLVILVVFYLLVLDRRW